MRRELDRSGRPLSECRTARRERRGGRNCDKTKADRGNCNHSVSPQCAVNLMAQIKVALGDLDKVQRVVRLGGFINATPDFLETPKVMNGASDLMVTAFGDKGRHARTTIGVSVLPMDAAVEVEGMFEVS